MAKATHRDVEFVVDVPKRASGRERIYRRFDDAAANAILLSMTEGLVYLDVLVWSEAGARWLNGDAGVEQYREDPAASVFERLEIKVNSVGRVP